MTTLNLPVPGHFFDRFPLPRASLSARQTGSLPLNDRFQCIVFLDEERYFISSSSSTSVHHSTAAEASRNILWKCSHRWDSQRSMRSADVHHASSVVSRETPRAHQLVECLSSDHGDRQRDLLYYHCHTDLHLSEVQNSRESTHLSESVASLRLGSWREKRNNTETISWRVHFRWGILIWIHWRCARDPVNITR
jgi:hypothetical protein